MSVLRAMNGVRQSLTIISEVLPTRLKEAFIEDMIAALLPEVLSIPIVSCHPLHCCY